MPSLLESSLYQLILADLRVKVDSIAPALDNKLRLLDITTEAIRLARKLNFTGEPNFNKNSLSGQLYNTYLSTLDSYYVEYSHKQVFLKSNVFELAISEILCEFIFNEMGLLLNIERKIVHSPNGQHKDYLNLTVKLISLCNIYSEAITSKDNSNESAELLTSIKNLCSKFQSETEFTILNNIFKTVYDDSKTLIANSRYTDRMSNETVNERATKLTIQTSVTRMILGIIATNISSHINIALTRLLDQEQSYLQQLISSLKDILDPSARRELVCFLTKICDIAKFPNLSPETIKTELNEINELLNKQKMPHLKYPFKEVFLVLFFLRIHKEPIIIGNDTLLLSDYLEKFKTQVEEEAERINTISATEWDLTALLTGPNSMIAVTIDDLIKEANLIDPETNKFSKRLITDYIDFFFSTISIISNSETEYFRPRKKNVTLEGCTAIFIGDLRMKEIESSINNNHWLSITISNAYDHWLHIATKKILEFMSEKKLLQKLEELTLKEPNPFRYLSILYALDSHLQKYSQMLKLNRTTTEFWIKSYRRVLPDISDFTNNFDKQLKHEIDFILYIIGRILREFEHSLNKISQESLVTEKLVHNKREVIGKILIKSATLISKKPAEQAQQISDMALKYSKMDGTEPDYQARLDELYFTLRDVLLKLDDQKFNLVRIQFQKILLELQGMIQASIDRFMQGLVKLFKTKTIGLIKSIEEKHNSPALTLSLVTLMLTELDSDSYQHKELARLFHESINHLPDKDEIIAKLEVAINFIDDIYENEHATRIFERETLPALEKVQTEALANYRKSSFAAAEVKGDDTNIRV